MRVHLVAVAVACGCHGAPGHGDAGGSTIPATFTDLGAPAIVAAVAFDGSGAPVIWAAPTDAGPYAVMRHAGSAWATASGPTAATTSVQLLSAGSGALSAIAGAGSGFACWQLTDAAGFGWTAATVPQPQSAGTWRFAGEDSAATFVSMIDGAGLTMESWSAGSAAWAVVPGFDEPGAEQGVVVAPDGSIYVDYSPPGVEAFAYQRVTGGATSALSPCTPGGAMVFPENGSVDAASDVFFEDCSSGMLFVIPAGGACYRAVTALPPGVCRLVQAVPDGTAFIFPTEHGEHDIYRLRAGGSAWDDITGDIDGLDGYVARDATTIFRAGNSAVGLAEADL
jgi:hypothetical protein